ncbi:hypothetical protein I317_01211 [Kwoniella heveanensis CBS 569]|nr:hypothetical protein I317_01211 [Kwoniella heveanensis CBS 569]
MTSITNGDAAPFSPLVLFEAEEFSWPPLPEITDRQFKQAVFTHRSLISSMALDMVGDHQSYETLAHVGDSLLNTFITCLLHTKDQKRKVGIATDLRSKLVNRQINTHISRHYGLPEQVRTGRAQRGTFRQSDDEAGEVYEAYLAGLFFSYAKAAATQAGNQGDLLTHGQAFDKLGRFLIPLYTPLVDNLQAIHDSNPYDSLGDVEALVELSEGSKAELNLFCQKKHLEIPEYDKGEKFWPSWISQHDRVGEHGKIWKGKCTVRLTNGRIITKEGVGNGTLKSAHNVAAYLVMQDLKGMSEFFRRW